MNIEGHRNHRKRNNHDSDDYRYNNNSCYHTRTVLRECFKRDKASQWKRPKFDPSPHQNPLTDLHKNWQA